MLLKVSYDRSSPARLVEFWGNWERRHSGNIDKMMETVEGSNFFDGSSLVKPKKPEGTDILNYDFVVDTINEHLLELEITPLSEENQGRLVSILEQIKVCQSTLEETTHHDVLPEARNIFNWLLHLYDIVITRGVRELAVAYQHLLLHGHAILLEQRIDELNDGPHWALWKENPRAVKCELTRLLSEATDVIMGLMATDTIGIPGYASKEGEKEPSEMAKEYESTSSTSQTDFARKVRDGRLLTMGDDVSELFKEHNGNPLMNKVGEYVFKIDDTLKVAYYHLLDLVKILQAAYSIGKQWLMTYKIFPLLEAFHAHMESNQIKYWEYIDILSNSVSVFDVYVRSKATQTYEYFQCKRWWYGEMFMKYVSSNPKLIENIGPGCPYVKNC